MTPLLVVLGAMLGAPLRYFIDRAVQSRHATAFPWGTATVNLTGCLLLGALTAAALSTPWTAFLSTGLCGALTTYSTFTYETFRLTETRAYRQAALTIVVNVATGLGATLLGYAVADALLA
ncbi:fluoride efflux transporter CrcB [Nocardia otitidiscaviarum]|uniref:fluoride efflux transporter CrcB n=1 Tax=Nocardia otitidiscaviarum TaxID=1823 RepID=UPI00189366C9|nr:fluoride efflux transporter CrcB [Nocardia otitidiscaviarum]MBF6179460.1 fluoride efflux transporter CrcB [Nocardia otitidiscaviarum]